MTSIYIKIKHLLKVYFLFFAVTLLCNIRYVKFSEKLGYYDVFTKIWLVRRNLFSFLLY